MEIKLNNEFALVRLEVDKTANGERLRIVSSRTGRSRSLDPLMLEVLTWLPVEHFISALSTPFGPEPDLGVVRPTDDSDRDIGSVNGATEADPR